MQKLAWDAGTRRMLSDPRMHSGDLTLKVVHTNMCMSVWGELGLKSKHIVFVLQGKVDCHTQPILELHASS